MPILVDEVVIVVEVGGAASPGAGDASPAPQGDGDARQRIVEECVERVLEALARREER